MHSVQTTLAFIIGFVGFFVFYECYYDFIQFSVIFGWEIDFFSPENAFLGIIEVLSEKLQFKVKNCFTL